MKRECNGRFFRSSTVCLHIFLVSAAFCLCGLRGASAAPEDSSTDAAASAGQSGTSVSAVPSVVPGNPAQGADEQIRRSEEQLRAKMREYANGSTGRTPAEMPGAAPSPAGSEPSVSADSASDVSQSGETDAAGQTDVAEPTQGVPNENPALQETKQEVPGAVPSAVPSAVVVSSQPAPSVSPAPQETGQTAPESVPAPPPSAPAQNAGQDEEIEGEPVNPPAPAPEMPNLVDPAAPTSETLASAAEMDAARAAVRRLTPQGIAMLFERDADLTREQLIQKKELLAEREAAGAATGIDPETLPIQPYPQYAGGSSSTGEAPAGEMRSPAGGTASEKGPAGNS